MERLTWFNGESWTQVQDTNVGYKAICAKLAAYEDAEEQGLLVRLPCKVGGEIYYIESGIKPYHSPRIKTHTVSKIEIGCKNTFYIQVKGEYWPGGCLCYGSDFGRTAFLDKKEAEKVLEKMIEQFDLEVTEMNKLKEQRNFCKWCSDFDYIKNAKKRGERFCTHCGLSFQNEQDPLRRC